MRTLRFLLVIFFITSIVLKSYGQAQEKTSTSKEVIDSLYKRITALERLIEERQRQADAQTEKTTDEQYISAIQTIQTGLEMGSEIEQIVPSTLRLLATKDLNETLNAINNPTSTSVGTSFSDMVIESASKHLLPQYIDESLKQQSQRKFKDILNAIYKGPLVQGILNSNPISSTINAAIQQAGLFEKNRESVLTLSNKDLKYIKQESSIKIPLNATNNDGPAFSNKEIEAFYSDLQKRIEFYSRMNQYGVSQSEITQQLYIEAKLIKQAIKVSKSEICKLLLIDPNNASADLNNRYSNLTLDQKRQYLRNVNFKKAVALSDNAKEKLPEVKEFNISVINSLIVYIDGYISILNEFKNIPDAKLGTVEIENQIKKLTTIQNNLRSPLNS